eukprot:c7955_g1_i1.p1 GENE.c7955_g1_i1~~c7955_g1_i1.p1  ORF type:complete len:275 (+),score=92.63 c7955_g1_i1:1-825(+)
MGAAFWKKMGQVLDKPITTKSPEDGTGSHLRFGVSSMQGWRIAQEDAHLAKVDWIADKSLFGVFDGHGGKEVSECCAKYLPEVLLKQLESSPENIEQALKSTFLRLDEKIISDEVRQEMATIVQAEVNGNDDEEGREISPEEKRDILKSLMSRLFQGAEMADDNDEDENEEESDREEGDAESKSGAEEQEEEGKEEEEEAEGDTKDNADEKPADEKTKDEKAKDEGEDGDEFAKGEKEAEEGDEAEEHEEGEDEDDDDDKDMDWQEEQGETGDI